MEIILSTYPRSGSQLLNDYVRQCTNMIPIKTHDPVLSDSELKVISIARNPFDSIVSIVSMDDLYYGYDLKAYIQQKIDHYIYFYSNLDKVDLLFSYEDVVSNTSLVVDEIVGLTNAVRNDNVYASSLKNYEIVDGAKVSGYVISSRTLDRYNEIAEIVKDYDLSQCMEVYTKSLARTTSL
jgi:hypothetical protein